MKESIIDDVMKDVRSSEENADIVIEQAKQQAKESVLAAEAEADKMRAENKQRLKDLRRQAQLDAAGRAAERRDALMKKGENAAKELVDNKNSAVEEAADFVVEKLLSQYQYKN